MTHDSLSERSALGANSGTYNNVVVSQSLAAMRTKRPDPDCSEQIMADSPYVAFSTLPPLMITPSAVINAAPTRNDEYLAYASSLAYHRGKKVQNQQKGSSFGRRPTIVNQSHPQRPS